jgi:hypothetical protein
MLPEAVDHLQHIIARWNVHTVPSRPWSKFEANLKEKRKAVQGRVKSQKLNSHSRNRVTCVLSRIFGSFAMPHGMVIETTDIVLEQVSSKIQCISYKKNTYLTIIATCIYGRRWL